MANKLKIIAFVQTIIILFLVGVIVILFLQINNNKTTTTKEGAKLLSPRIYSGILESKSFLILNYAPLKNDIETFIKRNNLSISVYVENMRDGAFMVINERRGYPPASLNKIPLAMLILKRIEDKEMDFDMEIEINDYDRTETSGTLFKVNENKLPVRVLIERMLQESDNTAFNALRHYSNPEDISLLTSYIDYFSEDIQQTENKSDELITTKSVYNLFSSLYLSTMLESKNSEYILSILTNTTLDIKKTANLPDDAVVAHKFASKYTTDNRIFHDCGIIYYRDMRIFYCVMTKDLDKTTAINVVGKIINKIFNYSVDARKTLDFYNKG